MVIARSATMVDQMAMAMNLVLPLVALRERVKLEELAELEEQVELKELVTPEELVDSLGKVKVVQEVQRQRELATGVGLQQGLVMVLVLPMQAKPE